MHMNEEEIQIHRQVKESTNPSTHYKSAVWTPSQCKSPEDNEWCLPIHLLPFTHSPRLVPHSFVGRWCVWPARSVKDEWGKGC